MNTEKKNYYDVLEIVPGASHQDIYSAYVKTKNSYTDDGLALYSILSPEDCKKHIELIEEAYTILGVPEKRREYDKARGLNQSFTPEGYIEKLNEKPSYKPLNSLDDMIKSTERETVRPNHNKSDFQYESQNSNKVEVNISKVAAFQRFGLTFEHNAQFDKEIEAITDFTGDVLKKIREYKNVSIERMSEMTKISKTYLRCIEEHDTSRLPAEVYTRGFVAQYAKILKLNSELAANSYMAHFRKLKAK